jgi:hypothetical protein
MSPFLFLKLPLEVRRIIYADHITNSTINYNLENIPLDVIDLNDGGVANDLDDEGNNKGKLGELIDDASEEVDEDGEDEGCPYYVKRWTARATKMLDPLSLVCKELHTEYNEELAQICKTSQSYRTTCRFRLLLPSLIDLPYIAYLRHIENCTITTPFSESGIIDGWE